MGGGKRAVVLAWYARSLPCRVQTWECDSLDESARRTPGKSSVARMPECHQQNARMPDWDSPMKEAESRDEIHN